MPRTKKAPGQAVDRRNGRQAELSATRVAPFPLPEGREWLPEVREAWEAFWSDPVAGILTSVDRVVVLRWAEYLQRAMLASAAGDFSPVTTGSMGQEVASPHYTVAKESMAIVERCEAQLGIGALHRARLGIAVATQERAGLAALNERYVREEIDDEPDPRIIAGRVE